MTFRAPKLFNRMLSNKGYTIDQTILIVAIIAILITLVIVTVGWQLINRSSGTKAGAQLKQIEDANGQFFSGQRVWPHQALTAAPTPTQNIQILANNGITTWAANIRQADLRNLLPGYPISGGVVRHSFGSGGAITQQANTVATLGTDTRMVVQFAGVPISEAREADLAIDGGNTPDARNGRVFYSATACLNTTLGGAAVVPTNTAPTDSTVFVCYAANTVQ